MKSLKAITINLVLLLLTPIAYAGGDALQEIDYQSAQQKWEVIDLEADAAADTKIEQQQPVRQTSADFANCPKRVNDNVIFERWPEIIDLPSDGKERVLLLLPAEQSIIIRTPQGWIFTDEDGNYQTVDIGSRQSIKASLNGNNRLFIRLDSKTEKLVTLHLRITHSKSGEFVDIKYSILPQQEQPQCRTVAGIYNIKEPPASMWARPVFSKTAANNANNSSDIAVGDVCAKFDRISEHYLVDHDANAASRDQYDPDNAYLVAVPDSQLVRNPYRLFVPQETIDAFKVDQLVIPGRTSSGVSHTLRADGDKQHRVSDFFAIKAVYADDTTTYIDFGEDTAVHYDRFLVFAVSPDGFDVSVHRFYGCKNRTILFVDSVKKDLSLILGKITLCLRWLKSSD